MRINDNIFEIILRRTIVTDLDHFYKFHIDNEAQLNLDRLTDKNTFISKYINLLNDQTVNNQTIIIDSIIVGSIAKFIRENNSEITYLIDKKRWGQGIATTALKQFLNFETFRPIFGRVVFDNFGSQKVLEKNGFVNIGTNIFFSNSRQTETKELIYKLEY